MVILIIIFSGVLNTSVECNEAISNARADTLGETIPQRIKAKDPVLHGI